MANLPRLSSSSARSGCEPYADVLALGRTAHPDVVLERASFVEFLETREACSAHAADLYLAFACAVGNRRALEKLDVLIVTQTAQTVGRIDRCRDFVSEIQQRLREHLLLGASDGRPRIANYAGRGSLAAFIRVTALRMALKEKRNAERQVPAPAAEDEPAPGDASLELIREQHKREFAEALCYALSSLDDRELIALRMSYLHHWTIDALADLFDIHRATAARWITRAMTHVREHTLRHLERQLAVTDGEAEELVGDLMSQTSLTSSLLAATLPELPPIRAACHTRPRRDPQIACDQMRVMASNISDAAG